jgi:hypothetical protein
MRPSAGHSQLPDASRDMALEDYRANISETSERLRFQVEFSHAALRNLHLTNGGAILALLTFLGNTGFDFNFRAIWWAFVWFGFGLVSSLSAYFGAYFSQAEFMNVTIMEAWNAQKRARGLEAAHDIQTSFRRGNGFMYFGIAAAATSLVFFIVGSFVALSGLE